MENSVKRERKLAVIFSLALLLMIVIGYALYAFALSYNQKWESCLEEEEIDIYYSDFEILVQMADRIAEEEQACYVLVDRYEPTVRTFSCADDETISITRTESAALRRIQNLFKSRDLILETIHMDETGVGFASVGYDYRLMYTREDEPPAHLPSCYVITKGEKVAISKKIKPHWYHVILAE